jgi:hypothetical protein
MSSLGLLPPPIINKLPLAESNSNDINKIINKRVHLRIIILCENNVTFLKNYVINIAKYIDLNTNLQVILLIGLKQYFTESGKEKICAFWDEKTKKPGSNDPGL